MVPLGPGGIRRAIRDAGAMAPWSWVVRDCVPRMPTVSQSSLQYAQRTGQLNCLAAPQRG